MDHRDQPKSALTETLDLFDGTNVEQMNKYLRGYGITIEREGDKFVAISSFGTVYRTYNADGSVESDINFPSQAEIDDAVVEVTAAQEDYDSENSGQVDDFIATKRVSDFAGAVREGDDDNAARILEESFRHMLKNPRSSLVNILRFYAHGGTLERRKLETTSDGFLNLGIGEDLVHEAVEPAAYTNVKPEPTIVKSESDSRTVNNTMRHAYRVLSDSEKSKMLEIKDAGLAFWNLLDNIGASRELSLAKTKIEEAVMWAIKDLTQ